MYRTTHRTRKAGVAALVALTVVSGFGFAPSAGAAPAVPADLTLTADGQPTIGVGKANQAAGNEQLTLATNATLSAGDQIVINVDDADLSTCVAGDTLAFSALPTVANTGTATILSTLESSAAGCGNDTLRINVTGAGTASISITNVNYTVGATSATGAVQVNGTLDGLDITDTGASNAFVSTVVLTANNPPKGAATSANPQVISPIVLTEQTNDGADAGLCITVSGPNNIVSPPAPTVSVTGGNDAAAVTVIGTNQLQVVVTPNATPTAAPSTFTINGVSLETSDAGLSTAAVTSGTCAAPGTVLSNGATTIGYAGEIDRIAGGDRFSTAQRLFDGEFGCNDNVIIARADLFPDALAASYLAGFVNTGILLTDTNNVPSATLNALRLEGVANVYLMGGTTAISDGVQTQLDNTASYYCGGQSQRTAWLTEEVLTLNVQRIAGDTRYTTAQAVAEYPGLDNAGTADTNGDADCNESAPTAIVTSGQNFPDALAAGPLAFNGDWSCDGTELPLLLSTGAAVPAATLAALTNLGIENVILVGGTSAVSNAAQAQLATAGYNVRRIAGVNRQATATALATVMMQEFGYDTDGASFARGDDFADALTGGPVAGSELQTILLTGSPTVLSADTAQFLRGWRLVTGGVQGRYFDVYGGTVAISNAVVQDILNNLSQQ